jgi:ATP-dependent Lon protease
VRDLERRISRIARKLARRDVEQSNVAATAAATAAATTAAEDAAEAARVVTETEAAPVAAKTVRKSRSKKAAAAKKVSVKRDDLVALLGPAPHEDDDHSLKDLVGVASGLAYTNVGGELLEIEVSVVPGRGRLQLTGQLGDVIKESAAAALSYVRSRSAALGIPADFHRTRDIHVHLPAGATPKDGPSAGIAMATALTSALTGIAVRGDIAMTGEITLRGRVLPIGGLREKGVAAHRYRMKDVIMPHGNLKDLQELPEEVRNSVKWHPVKTMDEVLLLALVGVPVAIEELADDTSRPVSRGRARKSVPTRLPSGVPT